ncbi:MAG TPA: glycoside hydrolase family 9 protein, partial [Polyangiaceae bacterium]|nr:glycoside hydrolase family 9 protein [Polyangiaceae bacterium]
MRTRAVSILGILTIGLALGACKKKGGSASASSASDSSASAQPTEPAPSGGNLVKNPDFEDGTSLPWTTSFSDPAKGSAAVEDGALCLTIDASGSNAWDAQLRHREMVIQKGHTYQVQFRIWSDKPTMARPKVGMSNAPYAEYWYKTVPVTTEPQTVKGTFTMNASDDATPEFAFHLGGNMARNTQAPFKVCIDDVYLTDPQYTPPPPEAKAALPTIRVNQVGYFTGGKKIATWVTGDGQPQAFEVVKDGQVVFTGKSTPFGLDADSHDSVQLLDFTKFKKPGTGYAVRVGQAQSPEFSIGDELYSKLKYDALKYYYHNRSGVPIAMPYAGQEKLTRAAGHAQSDKAVPCGKGTGCTYSLDVTGGWYDAGDHGKYVVNGGISVWTLLNQYESAKAFGEAQAFADRKGNIPESGNGVPDILDEARFELEFFLKMQVPEGKPKAGMVHHKIHDVSWTALGLRPDQAEAAMKRNLRPVSTAATLNVAATAAQGARIWKSIDPAFASKLEAAAERAWLAAQQNPAVYAPASDGSGGGPYDDKDVTDDFFWAASELWITTKKPEYRSFIDSSPWLTKLTDKVDGVPSSMNWASTDGLGTISLAVVPGALLVGEQATQRKKLTDAADKYLALVERQGYRVPFAADSTGKYPWGSNSFILNNLVVMGLAYDITKQDKYLEGVISGMDYLLGRNALSQSYVTGFGSLPLVNPHHRFWAKQADSAFPSAPAGAVSGGPNSSLQDPYVKAAGLA